MKVWAVYDITCIDPEVIMLFSDSAYAKAYVKEGNKKEDCRHYTYGELFVNESPMPYKPRWEK